MSRPRYTIGIDLGTSNSALSYVDTLADCPSSEILSVEQVAGPAILDESSVLPSFLYVTTTQEREAGTLSLSTDTRPLDYVVGKFALEQTAYLPGRVISSAKSWLCHDGVDREERILPWSSEEVSTEKRLSPVEVTAKYLRHFLEVWNRSLGAFHEDYRFEKQDIVITVPASFDEAAQRLTLAAAKTAGYPQGVRLLEEPQAAFYHWLERNSLEGELPKLEEKRVDSPLLALICDIGGGTTDFSLLEIAAAGDDGKQPEITRIAVSEHILLGGDNIDLTLAHCLESRLLEKEESPDEDTDEATHEAVEKKLSPRQWNHLVFACRALKEKVLSEDSGPVENGQYHVSVPGEGSSLMSSAISASITAQEVRELILEGFFPQCDSGMRPDRHASALTEWGLPYARDSRVSRHLAAFLEGRDVDAALYNGGSLKPIFLQQRLQELLASWQNGRLPQQLSVEQMDLAVARGAAYYGYLLRGTGRKIKAGYARSVYLELFEEEENETPELLCVLPQGFEPDHTVNLDSLQFRLLVGRPVRFQLYHSVHREQDKVGDLLRLDPYDFHALPPLQTVISLPPGVTPSEDGLLGIQLEVAVSETGLLQVFCVYEGEQDLGERWQLDFNLRKNTGDAGIADKQAEDRGSLETGVSSKQIDQASGQVSLFYGKKKSIEEKQSPKKLLKELEAIFVLPRTDWNTALLRSLWPALAKGITRRGRSLAHETTWLYLAGFVMRPGYGAELDDWRMKELWRCFSLGLSFPKENSSLVQWWMMWRRVAGGLDAGQQEALFNKAQPRLEKKGKDDPELFRLVGSLERLSLGKKTKLGKIITRRINGRKITGIEQYIWSLGRLSSRIPLYGSAHQVVSADRVAEWFEQLSGLDWSKGDFPKLNAAFSQACRMTGDRERDISPEVRRKVLHKMQQSGASAEQLAVVREVVQVDLGDQVRLFGEELPVGLRLVKDAGAPREE